MPYSFTVKDIEKRDTKSGRSYWRVTGENARGDWTITTFSDPGNIVGRKVEFEAEKRENGGWVAKSPFTPVEDRPGATGNRSQRARMSDEDRYLVTASAIIKSLIEAGKKCVGKDLEDALTGLRLAAIAVKRIEHDLKELDASKPDAVEALDDVVFEERG